MAEATIQIDYLDVLRDYALGWGEGTLCLPVGMLSMAKIVDHAVFVHWISLLHNKVARCG